METSARGHIYTFLFWDSQLAAFDIDIALTLICLIHVHIACLL